MHVVILILAILFALAAIMRSYRYGREGGMIVKGNKDVRAAGRQALVFGLVSSGLLIFLSQIYAQQGRTLFVLASVFVVGVALGVLMFLLGRLRYRSSTSS